MNYIYALRNSCNESNRFLLISISQLFPHTRGLLTFLSESCISYNTTARGPDILCNVIVSGYLTSLKSTNASYIYDFFIIGKCVRGTVEKDSRVGFGPRAVVWRPLSSVK